MTSLFQKPCVDSVLFAEDPVFLPEATFGWQTAIAKNISTKARALEEDENAILPKESSAGLPCLGGWIRPVKFYGGVGGADCVPWHTLCSHATLFLSAVVCC